MAVNFAQMLLQPTPAAPWDLSPGGSGTAREQLKLARERFAWEKQQADEQSRLTELKLKADQQRRAALAEKERLDREAKVQAKLLGKQQEAMQKFGEVAGSGKVQQAQAMLPYLDQLGYDVNTLGDVGGLPVFQLQNRAQEAERQRAEQGARASGDEMAGLGYPTNERGTLDDPSASRAPALTDEQLSLEPGAGELDAATTDALTPGDADMATASEFGGDDVADVSVGRGMMPGSLSQGDAFAQALAASQAAREAGGLPARAPAEEDWQGAVPRNVIDLPAMQAETLARLNPALKARVEALPGELQPGAAANAKAIGGLGLEASDALKEMDTALEDPVSIYNQKLNIQAQKEKEERVNPVQEEQLKELGIKRGNLSFKNGKIGDAVSVIQAADTVEELMKKGGKRNHEKAVNYLMNLTGNKGSQTEADALRIIGRGKLDSIEQLQDWLHERVVGGFSPEEITSINEFVAMQRARSTERVYGWLASNDQQMRNPKTHERTRAGYEEFRNGGSIPPELLDRYEEFAKKAEKGQGRSGSGQSAVDAGDLDAEKLSRVIGHESQGDAKATSVAGASGTMQIMPENLRAMGIEPEDFKKLSPAEQMPYNIRYLKDRGITKDSSAEDYAMAVAAPTFRGKPAGTVVYPKSDDPKSPWAQNPGWRPADGGDITVGSILKFYGLGGEKSGADAPKGLPEPKTPAEKRIVELLKKRGG